MNNKKIISILMDIESSVNVNSLTYNDICIWPLIRNQIASHLKKKNQHCSSQSDNNIFNSSFITTIKKIAICIWLIIKKPKNQKLHQNDILFLTRASEKTNLVSNKWYNKHADSFSDFFDKQYSIQHLQFSDDGRFPLPQVRPSFYLDFHLFVNQIKFKIVKHFLSAKIQNYQILEDYLKLIDISPPFSEKSLRLQIARIFHQKKVFSKIIRKCKPNLLFLVCYYCDIAMAAILACNEQNVPVVEFQHGAQNDHHLYLTHWTQIPKQGYQLLPDFFWNWGAASANRINKWAEKTFKHKAFVGGNLWASKWINEKFITDHCGKYNVKKVFPKGYKHILITLQQWPDHFPEYLLDIIKTSSPNWFWHIRQHPRHIVPEKEIDNYFLSLPNISIEEHYSRKIPLYLLLNNIDLHLTGFSTVAFEAALFEVPTIFFHENAQNGFQGILDDKLFSFAANKKEMIELLERRTIKEPNNNKSSYVIIEPHAHTTCMEEITEYSAAIKHKRPK